MRDGGCIGANDSAAIWFIIAVWFATSCAMVLEASGEGVVTYDFPSVLPGGGGIVAVAWAMVCVVPSVLVVSASCMTLNMPYCLLCVYPC